jgi:hypothetical protein
MKGLLTPRGLFAIGFVVLVATNIIVLSGVAANRSGNPESQVILTERELQLPYRIHEENSGLTLRFAWRTLGKDTGAVDWRSPAWFNREKLEELGFHIDTSFKARDNEIYAKMPIPKEVFLVLENDGEAYREAVRRAEETVKEKEELLNLKGDDKQRRDSLQMAKKHLQRERISESRLFVIDAGLEPKVLRARYADRTRFIIARGEVEARCVYEKQEREVIGSIVNLSVETLHVPLKHRRMFDAILAHGVARHNAFFPPRYTVEVAYGSRLEPWIVSVRQMNK